MPIAAGGPPPLGATPEDGGTTFAVWSSGEAVDFACTTTPGASRAYRLTDRTHGVWHAHVPGIGHGQRYGYRVHGPWDPWHGHRFNPAKLLVDPYARAIDGVLVARDDASRRRRARPATRRPSCRDRSSWTPVSTGPATGDPPSPGRTPSSTSCTCAASRCATRTCRKPLRGTYAGLAHPAVLEHLTSLGVTTVELLPVHHHVTELSLLRRGLTNFWGYNTLGFFAPHGGYSSSGTRGEQVPSSPRWCGRCTTPGSRSCSTSSTTTPPRGTSTARRCRWRGLDNPGYYRLRHGRVYEDYTGCGNTLDLRNPRTLALVTDSLRYWVQEMHVDGFRFDLAPGPGPRLGRVRGGRHVPVGDRPGPGALPGQADRGAVGRRSGWLPARPLPCPVGGVERPLPRHRAESWLADNASQGQLPASRAAGMRDLAYRATGSSDVFDGIGRGPWSSVNFVTAHDGFTLHDLVTYEQKRNEPNGEDNRDGSGHNRGWNCGIEGPTSDADGAAAAPADDAQPADDTAHLDRCADADRRATRPRAPSSATTTPTASTTRRPGSTGPG